jgi:hypothetical protein
MARVLHEGLWYDALTSSALYEKEFERIVMQHSTLLFPEFRPSVYKATVYSDTSSARPDYALIEQQYREWWIVELELANHPFEGHVLPQVSTLVEARYGAEQAAYLAARNPGLDENRVRDLMKGQTPRVLVVVNEPRPQWVSALNAIRAELAVFEIFRSVEGKHLYRFNGYTPRGPGNVVSRCRLDRALPWALRVDSPSALGFRRNESIEILFGETLSEWERMDSADMVWLVPKARVKLEKQTVYALTRLENGRLRLVPTPD